MRFLRFLAHLVVFTTTMFLFFMWVAPRIDNRGMIVQLGLLSIIYMTVAFALEWVMWRFFIKYKHKPVILKDGVEYYGDEGLAIQAAMDELALDSLKHATVVNMDDSRGCYLYIYDTLRKIYSDKYYFQIKKTVSS